MKRFLLCLIATLCIGAGVVGCALSKKVTPADVDPKAVDYAAAAGVIDPNDFGGYGNLEKAERLEAAVKSAYEVNVLTLEQEIERNELDYGLLNEITTRNTKIARAREEALFSEKGLLTMGLGMIGMGSLGGFVGMMRKRPQDITPEEMQQRLNDAGLQTGDKERQFLQLVKGAQLFLTKHQKDGIDDAYAKELKAAMSHMQDADTRLAVKAVKV